MEHRLRWLVEEVGHASGKVGDQSDGIADQIRRAEDFVQLQHNLARVVVRDAYHQLLLGREDVL